MPLIYIYYKYRLHFLQFQLQHQLQLKLSQLTISPTTYNMNKIIKILTITKNEQNLYKIYCFLFSTFKTKYDKILNGQYKSIEQMYSKMNQFQSKLDYIQKLKYRKALQDMHKKVTRIYKKQLQLNFAIQDSKVLQTAKKQTNNGAVNINHKLHQLSPSLMPTLSNQLFYEIQTLQYKPISEQMLLNIYSLQQLYEVVLQHVGQTKSLFNRNLDIATKQMLSNWNGEQQGFYNKIKVRCEYLEDQLMANIFDNYVQVIRQSQQAINNPQQNRMTLKKLKSNNKKTTQATFVHDYKFILNSNLTSAQHIKASQIAKILTKYSFSSNKIKTYAMKSLSNEGYKILTAQSLQNYLYILGYHRSTVTQLNDDNLYKLYDMLINHFANPTNNQAISQDKLYLKQISSMNSFLFYILANKIQIFQLIRQLYSKVIQNIIKYNTFTKNFNPTKQNKFINNKEIYAMDKQLFYIMAMLLESKYGLNYQQLFKQYGIKGEELQMIGFTKNNIGKLVSLYNSNAWVDFQQYLDKKQYKFSKSMVLLNSNLNEKNTNKISQDIVYRIQQKNFICLNLAKMDKNTEKPNGIGQLVLQYYRSIGQQIKIINPLLINKCETRTQKQQYFKSKLKGIKQPQIPRERRFLF